MIRLANTIIERACKWYNSTKKDCKDCPYNLCENCPNSLVKLEHLENGFDLYLSANFVIKVRPDTLIVQEGGLEMFLDLASNNGYLVPEFSWLWE